MSIHHILARCESMRVCNNRRSTWVEEFVVQRGPETCTLEEELEQYRLGIDILSITNMDDKIPSQEL